MVYTKTSIQCRGGKFEAYELVRYLPKCFIFLLCKCNSADINDSNAAFDIYDTEDDGDFSDDLENVYKPFKIIKNLIFKSHF